MKKLAVLSAAALLGVGALTSTGAQARDGGAFAAGLVGGLAAGALVGAAVSDGYDAPAYGYARPVYDARPAYGYDDGYRPAAYGYGAPHYRPRPSWAYAERPRSWERPHHCDRPYGYGGW